MFIEINAPASLPLGLVRLETETGPKTGLLGVTLQHPPVNLSTQAHPTGLQISGARADVAYVQAERFLQLHRLPQRAEIEIELAIPSLVGLGSEPLLGLSTAQALAWLNNLPLDDIPTLAQAVSLLPGDALPMWSYARGGLLLVDVSAGTDLTTPPLCRHELAHPEKEAWAFVLVLPRLAPDTPETLEADWLLALLQVGPALSLETGRLLSDQLWPALEADDLAAFGQSLMALQQLNEAALTAAGSSHPYTSEEQAILDLMRDHGTAAWGRSPTGLALYGLVKGARSSVELRNKLRQHLGFFGGRAMAAITDNQGATYVVKDYNLNDGKFNPIRMET